ncbi:MAG TPA: alpha/beta hydrolase-fold protein [Gaiellaceae bacterium]|nr:alpha/beta hydrolase-fold protein [Gaiellaceae bacterium]
MRPRPLAAALPVALAAAALALGTEVGGSSGGDLLGAVREGVLRSTALRGLLHFAVYLPPGYASEPGRRYPVVYFLHGLPAPVGAFRGFRFVPRALERLGLRAIVVAPQGARDGDPDPEYLDWGEGRNWETAIASELPAWVDARYRTIRSRRGRVLVGLSAGGYGAFLLALHHLAAFGAVESWSGYFRPTDPSGETVLDLGSQERDARASAHRLVGDLRGELRRDPTFLAFYVGTRDRRFLGENVELDRELTLAGVPHLFRLYPGGHDQTLWQAHAGDWLALALHHLGRLAGS